MIVHYKVIKWALETGRVLVGLGSCAVVDVYMMLSVCVCMFCIVNKIYNRTKKILNSKQNLCRLRGCPVWQRWPLGATSNASLMLPSCIAE